MSARSRDVQKMITIGFFILPDPYSPNGNSHLDHNASIDADFLKEVPLWGVKICKKILGVIFASKIEKTFLIAKA
jgi:hypothetical protein